MDKKAPKAKLNPELRQSFKTELDKLQTELSALSKAVNDLKKIPINIDVVAFVLQKASAKYNPSYTPISLGVIRAVLKGIESVDSYLLNTRGWKDGSGE